MTQLAIADLFLRETGNCIFTTNVQQIFASLTREEEEEEDRMAAESPGRPPSRGEEDQETLRMIADLGEAPGIEQLVEQSRMPEKISWR
jgi:hypothetical protein